MSKSRFTLLAVITVALVVAAAVSSYQRTPLTEVEKAPLYPELLEQINSVSEIAIKDHEHQTLMSRQGDQWVLKNRDGYPAIFNKVKDNVLSIAKLQILEGKTSNPALYTRLDVEGTESAPGKSTLITLRDEAGKQMAALVIGKDRKTSAASQTPTLYVRKVGEERALLVEGALTIKAAPSRWMNSQVFDIKAPSISEVIINHADGTQVHVSRDGVGSGSLSLHDIEEGYQLKSKATLNSLMTALEELRFQGVMANARFSGEGEKTTTILKTFDGLTVTATTHQIEKKFYTHFDFSYQAPAIPVEGTDPQQIQAYAEKMAVLTGPWKYEIPPFKANMLTRQKSDLLRKDAATQ